MVSEQRSKRPFAVYCIVLLELYLVASTGYCVWRARSVFRTDVDPVAACQDALPMLTPPDGLSLCATFGLDQAKSDVLFNGFAMLGFDIFFLVTAVWSTAVDPRAPKIGGFGIGLTVSADILAIGTLTGAAMNPARAFGPAIAASIGGADYAWGTHWIYWVGPILGGILASVIYKNIIWPKNRD